MNKMIWGVEAVNEICKYSALLTENYAIDYDFKKWQMPELQIRLYGKNWEESKLATYIYHYLTTNGIHLFDASTISCVMSNMFYQTINNYSIVEEFGVDGYKDLYLAHLISEHYRYDFGESIRRFIIALIDLTRKLVIRHGHNEWWFPYSLQPDLEFSLEPFNKILVSTMKECLHTGRYIFLKLLIVSVKDFMDDFPTAPAASVNVAAVVANYKLIVMEKIKNNSPGFTPEKLFVKSYIQLFVFNAISMDDMDTL